MIPAVIFVAAYCLAVIGFIAFIHRQDRKDFKQIKKLYDDKS